MAKHLQAGAAAGGDLAGTFPSPVLGATGVTPGSYTNVNLTVDAKGRITNISSGSAGGTVSDATTTAKGIVQLAGDLAGTAAAPTVPGLAGKEPSITAGTSAQYYRGDKTMQTLNQDAVPSGTTNKAYTATEQTKLAGVATGADVTATQLPVATHAATAKATPVDADETNIADSAASFGLKKVTWANIKATLKTYFDTLYQAILVSGTNIKTINGSSILGSGDLTVTGGSGSAAGWLDYYHLSNTSFAGRYYSSPANGKALTASTVATGKLYATPFLVGKSTSFDQIAMNCTTLVASATGHIGIYNNTSDTNLYPSSLIVDSGSLDLSSVGNKTATITQTLAPGLYWLVSTFSSSSTGVRGFNTDNLMPILGYDFGAGVGAGWSATFTYGALPTTFPATGQAVLTAPPYPLIGLRVA